MAATFCVFLLTKHECLYLLMQHKYIITITCLSFHLQECADNVNSDTSSPSKDALLEEACKKYDEATRLNPTLHDVCISIPIDYSLTSVR